jgi:hypothetical protein
MIIINLFKVWALGNLPFKIEGFLGHCLRHSRSMSIHPLGWNWGDDHRSRFFQLTDFLCMYTQNFVPKIFHGIMQKYAPEQQV